MLSVELSLLYLIGDPEDPVEVWKKVLDTFQKKTSANKLELRQNPAYQSNDGNLRFVSSNWRPSKRRKLGHAPLASLPESFNMFVTALEANPEVPKIETVTECLLHEERKTKERDDAGLGKPKALTAQDRKGKFTCHYCGKPGHFK